MFSKTLEIHDFWAKAPWAWAHGPRPWGPWDPPFFVIFWKCALWSVTYLEVFLWCLGVEGTGVVARGGWAQEPPQADSRRVGPGATGGAVVAVPGGVLRDIWHTSILTLR